MTIKVYGKPACPKCDMAKRFMGEREYEYIDLSQDADSMALVKSLGAREAPFIMDGDKVVGGYSALVDYFSSIED